MTNEFQLPKKLRNFYQKNFDLYHKRKERSCRKIWNTLLGGELCGTCFQENDPMVNNPCHYQSAGGIEVIDIIEEFEMNFNLGNVIKYVLRHKNKNGIQDLKKALWYLQREINDSSW